MVVDVAFCAGVDEDAAGTTGGAGVVLLLVLLLLLVLVDLVAGVAGVVAALFCGALLCGVLGFEGGGFVMSNRPSGPSS